MYIIIPLCSFYGGLELNGLPGDNVSYNGLPGDNVGCLGKGGRGGEQCLSSYLYVPSMMDWRWVAGGQCGLPGDSVS